MSEAIDIAGKRFGKLVALTQGDKSIDRHIMWWCLCDCGELCCIVGSALRRGMTNSCGHLQLDTMIKHGLSQTNLYKIWSGMKSRCYNHNHISYKYYGGKGIIICDDWMDIEKLSNWAMNNGYIVGLTIDRINSDGDYCPENCEWVTRSENTKHMLHNHKIKRCDKYEYRQPKD